MKILLASDIHGSKSAIDKVLERAGKENCDKIALLGDLYYHGPRNPLPENYAPMEVAKTLNEIKEKLIVIKGNCDAEVDEMISDFPFEKSVVLTVGDKKIYLTHGHVYNEDNIPDGCDVLVYGHFHVGFIKEKDGVIVANPGSCALPKDGFCGYLLLTEDRLCLKDFDGNVVDERKL